MKKDKLHNILTSKWARLMLVLFGVLFIFALWAIISHILNSPVLPGPNKVMPLFFELLGQGKTYLAVGATLLRLLIAFSVSFACAFILGIIAGLHNEFKTFLSPLIIVLKTIPTATFVFAFFVYFENDLTLFLVIFLVLFPILYEAISNGINNIDKNILNALRVDSGIHNPKAIFGVIIPSAFQYILLGIIQTLGLGMKVSIMAEILIGERTLPGIGVNIISAYIDGNATAIYAHSLFAVLIVLTLDIISKTLKKKYD